MFEVLTVAERGRLTDMLTSAGEQFRDEYRALARLQNDMSPFAWPDVCREYQIPAAGPHAWLGAATDAVFAAVEVSGATSGPSVYWTW